MGMDDTVVFGWFFDFACAKLLEEFEKYRTVDKKSERQLMAGLLQYTMDDVEERVARVDFLQLLCFLVDGDQPDLKFESAVKINRDTAQLTPLEHALILLDKLQTRGAMDHLREQLDQARTLIKTQAVMTFLRKDRQDEAMAICQKLWADKHELTDEEKDLERNLTEISLGQGKRTKAFMTSHNMKHFYSKLMPTLKAINDCFEEPFLLKVLKRKEMMEKDMKKDLIIPCSVLRKTCGPTAWNQAMAVTKQMAQEARGSVSSARGTSSSSDQNRTGRKRMSSTSSSESDVISPVKRGKSIRSINYGRTKEGLLHKQDNKGEVVNWDLSDEEEEGQVSRTELHTPKIRHSLAGPSPSRHQKITSDNEGRARKPWTEEEEAELRDGIQRYGVGKWAEIKLAFNLDGRTNVQLKDKYRNWVKNGLI